MIGKDTNSLFSRGKEDKTDTSTATSEAWDETKKKIRIEMHLLTAMLIATVTYQAALAVPAGYIKTMVLVKVQHTVHTNGSFQRICYI